MLRRNFQKAVVFSCAAAWFSTAYLIVNAPDSYVRAVAHGPVPAQGAALYASEQPDTVHVSEDATRIEHGGRGKLVIAPGQNWYDRNEKRYKKRELGIKAEVSDGYDYAVSNDVVVKMSRGLDRVRIESPAGDYVEYFPLGGNADDAVLDEAKDSRKLSKRVWQDADVELEATTWGYKENVILRSSSAPDRYCWRIASNLHYTLSGGVINFDDRFVSYVHATDASGLTVPLTAGISGDTLTVVVDTSGVVYPVTLDPSTEIIQESLTFCAGGYIEAGTYEDSRSSTFAMYAYDSTGGGQYDTGILDMGASGVMVYRVFMAFNLSDAGLAHAIIDSGYIEGTRKGGNSDQNWYSEIFTAYQTAKDTSAFNDFDGWQTGMTPYTGTALSDSIEMKNWPINETQRWTLNAAGVDTLDSRKSGSFKVVVMCTRDVNAAALIGGGQDIEVELYCKDVSKLPRLIVYYRTQQVTNFQITDSTATTFTWAADTLLEGLSAFDSINVILASDSSVMGSFTDTTGQITGLTVDTEYIVRAVGYYDGNAVSYSNLDTVTTPKLPEISGLTALDSTYHSITVKWDTVLAATVSYDSFAVFLARDSVTRVSQFTADTTVATYDTLTRNSKYDLLVKGFNADTVRSISGPVTHWTDTLYAYRPFGLQLGGYDYPSISFSIIDTSGFVSKKLVFYDSLNGITGDTISLGIDNPDTLYDTLNFTGYYDSLATIKVTLVDTFGYTYGEISSLSLRTLAQRVPAVSVIDTCDTVITMYFPAAADSNPDRVFYQLFDSTLAVYINPITGDTSYSDTSWYIQSAFDTVAYDVGINTLHELFVNSRNSDSLKTGYYYSNAIWSWAQVPDVDSVFAHGPDSVFIRIDPQNNPAYTYFALEDSVTGLFYDLDNLQFRSSGVTVDSSWAWYSYSDWGGSSGRYIIVPNGSTYVLRFYSKDGNTR